jgi:hypothetical protein
MNASISMTRSNATLPVAAACPSIAIAHVSPKHVEPQTRTQKWYGLGGSRQDFVLPEAANL